MKVLLNLVLVNLISFTFGGSGAHKIAFAISKVVSHMNISNNLRIVKYSEKSTEIDRISNEILRRNENASITFEIFDIKSKDLIGFELNTSAILLFERFSLLGRFVNSMVFKASNADFVNILVYCETLDANWYIQKNQMHFNLVFIYMSQDHLMAVTTIRFTSASCDISGQMIATNEFSKSEKRWLGSKFFLPQFKDLHKCPLTIKIVDTGVGYDQIVHHENGTISAKGLHVNLFNILAEKLNFTISYTDQSGLESIFSIDLRFLRAKNNPSDDSFISHPHVIAPLQFLVPPGELYTPEEKLLLPFDLATWICFISVFAIALLTIFLLSNSRDSLKEYFFGSNVNTPTMNLFQHFFGFGQTILPEMNFARFILMVFILFCLIMRTAYQGKMFEFLTSDVRKKAVATIEKIVEKNMTIFVTNNSEILISEVDVLKG